MFGLLVKFRGGETMKRLKNDGFKDIKSSPLSAIIYAAVAGRPLEEVGVKPSVQNLILYKKIKAEVLDIRNSGQGVIIPD